MNWTFPLTPPEFIKPKLVVASGHFVLGVHAGHVRYLRGAAALGKLYVIVNNDGQLRLKGYEPVYSEAERLEVVGALAGVKKAILSVDADRSVCKTLELIHQLEKVDIFANGGDVDSCREKEVCTRLGIEMVYGVGGREKVNSTSAVFERVRQIVGVSV